MRSHPQLPPIHTSITHTVEHTQGPTVDPRLVLSHPGHVSVGIDVAFHVGNQGRDVLVVVLTVKGFCAYLVLKLKDVSHFWY